MRKKIIIFAVMLLFLVPAINPLVSSDNLNINSDQEEEPDEKFVEVEVYDFKGKHSYEKIKKKITTEDLEHFQKELDLLKNKDLSLKDKIVQHIAIFKKYDLISGDYSFEKMENMFESQRSYLENIARIGNISNNRIFQSSDKSTEGASNILALLLFNAVGGVGISIGFPPWRILWPFVIPYMPHFSAWATAFFDASSVSLDSIGLLGEQSSSYYSGNFLILLGFIGFVAVFPPAAGPPELHVDGFGFSAFCSTT